MIDSSSAPKWRRRTALTAAALGTPLLAVAPAAAAPGGHGPAAEAAAGSHAAAPGDDPARQGAASSTPDQTSAPRGSASGPPAAPAPSGHTGGGTTAHEAGNSSAGADQSATARGGDSSARQATARGDDGAPGPEHNRADVSARDTGRAGAQGGTNGHAEAGSRPRGGNASSRRHSATRSRAGGDDVSARDRMPVRAQAGGERGRSRPERDSNARSGSEAASVSASEREQARPRDQRGDASGHERRNTGVAAPGRVDADDHVPARTAGPRGRGASSHANQTSESTYASRVKVATHESDSGHPRAKAWLTVSPALEATLRAEAREAARQAAREEVRARAGSRTGMRMRVARIGATPTATFRVPTGDAQAVECLRLVHEAWRNGDWARAARLLQFHFGSGRALPAITPAGRMPAGSPGLGNGRAGHAPGDTVTGAHVPSPSSSAGASVNANVPPVADSNTNVPAGTGEVLTPEANAEVPASAVAPALVAGPTGEGSPPLSVPPADSDAHTRPGTPETPDGNDLLGVPEALNGHSTPAARISLARSATGSQLPRTGFEIPLIVVLGAAAISAGALIRRRTH